MSVAERARNPAKHATDRWNRPVHPRRDKSSSEHANQRSGNDLCNARRDKNSCQRNQCDDNGIEVRLVQVCDGFDEIQVELFVGGESGESKEIVDLARKDNYSDARSEAGSDRKGNKPDERAGTENAHQNEHDSSEKSGE